MRNIPLLERHPAAREVSRYLLPAILTVLLAACVTAQLAAPGIELPVHAVPNLGSGAEFYFAPDSRHLIGNAKREGDDTFHVYTLALDGTEIRRINDRGLDACSFYFPDGQHIVWTSTRDNPDIPKGNYSDPRDYPQGAEIYVSNVDGSGVRRLTQNHVYEAEVSVSADGRSILFGRQTDGKMELWRMRPDGTGEFQITHLEGFEPGGAQYLPDGHTIIFRAWRSEDQGHKSPLPMNIYTIRDDGTGLRQVTHDDATNWAPFPAPDGRHFAFVKVLPPRNYEIYLGDLESTQQIRLTYNDAFDGFPAISPDGHWLAFSSSRGYTPGQRTMGLYLQDISSLAIGAQSTKGSQRSSPLPSK